MSDLDTNAVESWAAQNMPGFKGPIMAEKLPGGQSNPTYRLNAGSGTYILRRKPPGQLLKSAHAVDREFRVQQALAGSDVPVAHVHALCEDDSVIGAMFYVMDAVEGRIFEEPQMSDLDNDARTAIIDEMSRVLVAIHNVDLDATGLSDFGPDGNYYRRQVDRWAGQYRASETETIKDMDALIEWLDQNVPADDGQRTLVHGDYRIDNLIFDATGPQCRAVLDWELSTTGHPYADLAAVIMQWSMPRGQQGRGLAGVNREKTGLWSDQQFIDTYCERRNLPGIDGFGFYLAFAYFRMGAILQGVKKRALDGNASDPKRGLKLGQYVPLFAMMGLNAAK